MPGLLALSSNGYQAPAFRSENVLYNEFGDVSLSFGARSSIYDGAALRKRMRTLLAVTFATFACMTTQAQGTVFFANLQQGGPNAPVYQSDGVTKASGPQFMAELLGGPSADQLAFVAQKGFVTGGYFLSSNESIPNVAPGVAHGSVVFTASHFSLSCASRRH